MVSKKESLIYINGEYVRESEAKISVFDHGFLYGDGVFENMRAYNGVVFKLDNHLKLLYESAKGIALHIPIEITELKKDILETLRVNKLKDAFIKVIVTRGCGGLSIDIEKSAKPNIIIIAKEKRFFPKEAIEKGIKVITASTRRIPPNCFSVNIKSLNCLNNIIAKLEAQPFNVSEVIMLDLNGFVSEFSNGNLFYVKNNILYTPTSKNSLPGVTRETVINIARELGYKVVEDNIILHELYNADEIFLTNASSGIIPVVEVDKRKISNGKPGIITKKIISEYILVREREGTPI